MEPLTLLQAKDAGDIVAIADDDAFWFELGQAEKATFRPTAEAMVRDGAAAASETFGLRPQIGFQGATDIAIRDQVDSYLDDWWLAQSNTERAALRGRMAKLARGEFEGGFPEFRRSIEDLYGTGRGRMIAETETTRLWTMGNEISMQESGVKEYVWRTVNDDRVDQDCRDLNGTIHPVGGQGERPPKHPRCRCAIIPVPPDLELEPAPPPPPIDAPARALPPVTPDAPVADVIDIAPLGTTVGSNAAVRASIDRAVSRNLSRMQPRERELIGRSTSHLRVGAGRGASGEHEFGGRIGFKKKYVDKWIAPYAEQPSLLTASGAIGQPARRGFLLTEHELTHGINVNSRSLRFHNAKPRNAAARDKWRARNEKTFGDKAWTNDEIDQFYAHQRSYSGGGKTLEEGTTELHSRNKLRRALTDEHGLSEVDARKLLDSSTWAYDQRVRHIQALADNAIAVDPAASGGLFGARLANATQLSDDFVRTLANEIASYDRGDALARFFVTKWTGEIGPVAGRAASGQLIGGARVQDFYDEIRRVSMGGRAVDRLPQIQARWKKASDDFASRLTDAVDPLDPVVIIDETLLDASQQPPVFKDLISQEVEVVVG